MASPGSRDPASRFRRRGGWWRRQPSRSRRAELTALFLLTGAVVLVLWTIFLGLTLPPKYDARHWNLLWIGFDVALITLLLLAAWAARYRRQILTALLIVAGTLLVCDAWFDVVTSWGNRDDWLTMLTGFGGELPLGIFFFFWLSHRLIMNTLTTLHHQTSTGPRPQHLRDFTFVDVERNDIAPPAATETRDETGTS